MIRFSTSLFLLTALLLGPTLITFAQATRVSGTVTYNGIRPLANVTVSLDGTYDGAVTNEKGEFSFDTDEKGQFTLVAKLTGFVDVALPVELTGKGPLKLKLIFTTKSMLLKDVVVRPRLFDLNDKNKYTTLNSLEVLTTATDGNVLSAMKTLPGAQPVGESGDLFVRGGTGTETKVYIDGLLVSNFTYSSPANMAARSRFAPGMFKGTFFSTGGYSAQYGQALSSALVLETEDQPVQSSTELTISPIMAGVGVERLSADKSVSYGGGVSHTNLSLYSAVMPGAVRFNHKPAFWDGNAFVRKQFRNGGMLKLFVNGGWSTIGVNQANIDYPGVTNRIRLTNHNLYTNLTYRQNLARGWKWQSGLSYGRNTDQTGVGIRFENGGRPDSLSGRINDQSALLQFRNVLSKLVLNRTRLTVGTEVHHVTEHRNGTGFTALFLASFAETESYLTDRLSARIGVRAEYSSRLGRANVAPRLSVGYSAGANGLLSVSYGKFYQKPDRPYLLRTPALTYTAADHYIVSYQKIGAERTFRTEVFCKQYAKLVQTKPALSNGGSGYARGFELFYRDKKSVKGVDFWVSYSFLDTKRQFLDYPTAVQPSFAARHTASVVAKHFFTGIKTNLGLTYTYGAGRPYANPTRPVADFMTDRTPAYHNLGLSLAHLMAIRKAQSVLVMTVSNVLGNQQTFSYTYSNINPARREAVRPTNNPFVYLGLFITIGVDRRQEIINSQL
ncbi:MAG: TonB-dependent receptor [Bacteroidetes bacterium]|nr:TonB-dependent receptor [Fibrella sp.]